MTGRTDTATRLIEAPPAAIYRAFLDPDSLVAWLPPTGMSGRVLLFEPWEGGRYRIELLYTTKTDDSGKTTSNSDVTAGRFLALEPDRRISQSIEFESEDESFAGEMIMTWTFETAETATIIKSANSSLGLLLLPLEGALLHLGAADRPPSLFNLPESPGREHRQASIQALS